MKFKLDENFGPTVPAAFLRRGGMRALSQAARPAQQWHVRTASGRKGPYKRTAPSK